MSREEALRENPLSRCPSDIKLMQALIDVPYFGMDGKFYQGQLVIDEALAPEVRTIFARLLEARFPIARMRPIVAYLWNDMQSMLDNNSSGFNFRTIANTSKISQHAFGRAIDINPLWNPYFRGAIVEPWGAIYNPNQPGTITKDSLVVEVFKQYGWLWGGDCWSDRQDYQHFEKPF